eukprot:TRINITY_DN8154_c2_g1_i2.p1 TRINITY_DN8154_c2_g1~~TRINITY_DN8154_c2_g1_i2.p1  ORF type:complete len:1012 (+),score=148.88 TRINITY_DN8154_c2_g1_i2:1664-4699(+)
MIHTPTEMGEGEGGASWEGATMSDTGSSCAEVAVNPLSELRRELVNGPVFHPLEELEQETVAEKLVFDRMHVDDIKRLGDERAKARQDEEMQQLLAHRDKLEAIRRSKEASLLRARDENKKRLEKEQQRFRDAVIRRNVVRHNVDAYFQQSHEKLKTFVKTRKSQVTHKYGEMTTSAAQQFELDKIDWDSIPQQVEVHISSVRGLKDKIPKGDYVMLVSKYSQLGGEPFKWSLRDPNGSAPPACPFHEHGDPRKADCEVCRGWVGSTTPVKHRSRYHDVDLPLDTSIYTFFPPRKTIKPYAAFIFELVRLPDKPSELPQTVGWGAFPVINGRFSVIKGKFKTPLLRGGVDSSVEHYTKVEDIVAEDIENWLGNIYFDVVPHPRECDGKGEFDIEATTNAKRLGVGEYEESEVPINRGETMVVGGMKTLGRNLASMAYMGKSFKKAEMTPKRRRSSSTDVGLAKNTSWSFGLGATRTLSMNSMPIVSRRRKSSIAFVDETGDSDDDDEDDDDKGVAGFGRLRSKHMSMHKLLEKPTSDDNSADDVDSNDASSGGDSDNEMLACGDVTDQEQGELLFDLIDQDNDGVLSRDELHMYLVNYPEVKEKLSISNLAEFFDKLDADSDGRISKSEFAAMWAAMASGAADMFGFRDKENVQEDSYELVSKKKTLGKSFRQVAETLGTGTGTSTAKGKLFNALDNIAKNKKSKRRVLVERGEKWGQYTTEINDTSFLSGESASWSLQLQYCWRGILDELNLKNPGELKFWFVILVFLIALYSQLYVHGIGQYCAAFVLGLPTANIDPKWYGLIVEYDSNHTSAFQELFIVLISMTMNIGVIAMLIAFSTGIKVATGGLPQQTSKFVYCLSLAYLVFPFLHLGIDLWGGYSGNHSDIMRLIDFYNANQYESFFGISTFATLYLNISAVVGVMNYLYTMRVHLNGILQDCFWRINVVNERNFFVPLDLEVSKKELEYVCRKSEMWRGRNGERRKTKSSLLVTTVCSSTIAHYRRMTPTATT